MRSTSVAESQVGVNGGGNSPYDARTLDAESMEMNRETNRQLAHAFSRNRELVGALQKAREQIEAFQEEIAKLTAPPSTYGVFVSVNEDGTVNLLSQGRKVK